jgi:antitoxin component YwqK of YwqJK toxin-antitoxin module
LYLASVLAEEQKEASEPWPDLSDPKKLKEIMGLAMLAERIPVSTKDGERLLFMLDRRMPYTGWSKKLHPNGKIDDLIHYKDGKQDGPWNRWYDNGQRQYDFMMKQGKMVSGLGWKPTGEPSPTKIVDGTGLCVGYHVNGRKRFQGKRVNGELEGIVNYWYGNGAKYWERRFKDGKANGPAKEWIPANAANLPPMMAATMPINPKDLRRHDGRYENNLRVGEWLELDDRGIPAVRRTYRAGVVTKTASAYAD